jgi:hypothetical protein
MAVRAQSHIHGASIVSVVAGVQHGIHGGHIPAMLSEPLFDLAAADSGVDE